MKFLARAVTNSLGRGAMIVAVASGLALAGLGIGSVVLAARLQPQAKPQMTAKSAAPAPQPAPRTPSPQELQLTELSRTLRDKPSDAAYQRLSDFARRHADAPVGARAALALGFYDYNRKRYPEARQWFLKGAADPLLADYALYWQALTDRAAEDNAAAFDKMTEFLRRYPGSVMTESAVQTIAEAALALDRPADALAALAAYRETPTKPALLLLRAQAREKIAAARGQKPVEAAEDYLAVVYRFPLNPEAKAAAEALPALRNALGEQFPGTPITAEIARAEALYEASRWIDSRAAYREILPKLTGQARDRARLRIAQATVRLGGGRNLLAELDVSDSEVDAERLYAYSQELRSAKQIPAMLATVERLAERHPQSTWTEEALFAVGNYYWTELDRERAAAAYQRVADAFPAGRNAATARWRVIWTAYLNRDPGVTKQLEDYLKRYPNSSFADHALYWLGRATERAGNVAHARSFYHVAAQRFPQTYFGGRAEQRLREIGAEPLNPAELLPLFPPAPPLGSITDPIPEAAAGRWNRAEALRTIAFDNSVEAELRAAWVETRHPRLLLAVAEAAVDAGRYGAGITVMRQVVPQLEARQHDEVPEQAWHVAFPLPYRSLIEREARRNQLDPMLVAGLMRQESAFRSDAVSRANAIGLMQIWPPTGQRLARRLKLRYTRARLFDPEYNVRLGTVYLSSLLRELGTPEAALAAYNAGETRVAQWTRGQSFEEIAEFVESIPFTETRNYVQVVMRNAEIYRRLHGGVMSAESASVSSESRD